MRKTSLLFLSFLCGLFIFSAYAAQSLNEAHAQIVTTGASGETGVQGNGFSRQVARTVPTDAASAQAGTMKVGAPAESQQREEKKDTNPQAPKAPTGLRIIRAN